MKFVKYQGAGNDFVIIDNRNYHFPKQNNIIKHLCDRHFGIGGDGLILLEINDEGLPKMIYYNSDGNEGSLCGNGSRCFVQFCYDENVYKTPFIFAASDGLHHAKILETGLISIEMKDVSQIEIYDNDYILNTGSPHYCSFIKNIETINVNEEGKKIRYNNRFFDKGINVNFVSEISQNHLKIRTYERGVENETLACGTGVTAAAIAYSLAKKEDGFYHIKIDALGGNLEVNFIKKNETFSNIQLSGPAKKVFAGSLDLNKIF